MMIVGYHVANKEVLAIIAIMVLKKDIAVKNMIARMVTVQHLQSNPIPKIESAIIAFILNKVSGRI